MSKIGRKPINIGDAQVEIKDNEIHYKGKFAQGVHELPDFLGIKKEDKTLLLVPEKLNNMTKKFWGLHRALLANKISGAQKPFEKGLTIVGLGYKAQLSGKKITLSLGYTHKIDVELPEGVTVEIDKSGQNLTFKSPNKEVLGQVCAHVRSLRPPEPYKGTGVKYVGEEIIRKAGKAKSV